MSMITRTIMFKITQEIMFLITQEIMFYDKTNNYV